MDLSPLGSQSTFAAPPPAPLPAASSSFYSYYSYWCTFPSLPLVCELLAIRGCVFFRISFFKGLIKLPCPW